MATYSRSEVTTTRIEYHVPATAPWFADWVEVYKAVAAVHAELRETGELAEGEDAAAGRIRIEPRDDEIVVSYVQEVHRDS